MASFVSYHPGGHIEAAPQKNRSEMLDGSAGTYTAWDKDGQQVASRPLTASEQAEIAAQDAATTRDANRSTMESRLDQAETNLLAYINLSAPTAAQTTAAVKMLCRVALGLVRLTRNRLDDPSGT